MPPMAAAWRWTPSAWARAVLPEAQRVAATLLEMGMGGRVSKRKYQDGHRDPGNPVGGQGVSGRPRRGSRVVVREHSDLTPIQARDAADPRHSSEARAKKRRAMVRINQENKKWEARNDPADRRMFNADILPHLQHLPLSALMEATGLTKGACSQMRAGKTVPHARHFAALSSLITHAAASQIY